MYSYHRVGRSFHNYESAAKIVKVLWHPLAVEGASLLVLTDDANIRFDSRLPVNFNGS